MTFIARLAAKIELHYKNARLSGSWRATLDESRPFDPDMNEI
jgi:hypothetical protein